MTDSKSVASSRKKTYPFAPTPEARKKQGLVQLRKSLNKEEKRKRARLSAIHFNAALLANEGASALIPQYYDERLFSSPLRHSSSKPPALVFPTKTPPSVKSAWRSATGSRQRSDASTEELTDISTMSMAGDSQLLLLGDRVKYSATELHNLRFVFEGGVSPFAGHRLEAVLQSDAKSGFVRPNAMDACAMGRRLKKINEAKGRVPGYLKYRRLVAKHKRVRGVHVSTPSYDDLSISKRRFDGQFRVWIKAVHAFDDLTLPSQNTLGDDDAVVAVVRDSATVITPKSADAIMRKRRVVGAPNTWPRTGAPMMTMTETSTSSIAEMTVTDATESRRTRSSGMLKGAKISEDSTAMDSTTGYNTTDTGEKQQISETTMLSSAGISIEDAAYSGYFGSNEKATTSSGASGCHLRRKSVLFAAPTFESPYEKYKQKIDFSEELTDEDKNMRNVESGVFADGFYDDDVSDVTLETVHAIIDDSSVEEKGIGCAQRRGLGVDSPMSSRPPTVERTKAVRLRMVAADTTTQWDSSLPPGTESPLQRRVGYGCGAEYEMEELKSTATAVAMYSILSPAATERYSTDDLSPSVLSPKATEDRRTFDSKESPVFLVSPDAASDCLQRAIEALEADDKYQKYEELMAQMKFDLILEFEKRLLECADP